ncbi:Papain family cysteine protease [Clostridium acidisoli DSM 12555]|uniref:Papain family cysteine protease n=1 Tax=Clostridium acidisoli DSM 12555 TaxID=1121291 RepID=A0A1W1XCT3_9CLOT|nr:C1 family peptidase [Clostridium acidisoli]SMC21291.1 Papain family cysteine protease [Clostridium acidisoli DSM 12555]
MGKKLPYKYNLKPSLERSTDLLFHENVEKTESIPQSADLRAGYGPVKDQGELGACTSFSACSVLEYLLNKDIPLSELYFYYQERKEDNDVNEDAGSTIARSALVATTIGTCTEALDPYDIKKFTATPSAADDKDAKNHKAMTKYKVKTIDDILYSVGVLKRPVLIGVKVYESFENITSNGYIPLPKNGEQLLGGHALNICGYFSKPESSTKNPNEEIKEILPFKKYDGLYFIIRNSWGENFGDKGYLYMPAEFLQKYSSDWWHIDL